MEQLRVEAEGVAGVGPDVVWTLLSNANSYSRWGPWQDGGYRPSSDGPSREGSIQWLQYGRRITSVEEIVEMDAPRRLVYAVVGGLPVKNYRAAVTLTPTLSGGTAIRWTATWDKTFLGRIVHRKLEKIYPEIVSALVAAADVDQTPG